MTTTLVAHCETLVAYSLQATLDADGLPVQATCRTGTGVVAACRHDRPDVVVAATELDDGPLHGHIAAILRTTARLLIVCDEPTDAGVRLALLAGASGCLPLRHADADQIGDAVRAVAAGQAALHPSVAASMLQQWRDDQRDRTSHDATLSPREMQVLQTVCQGLTTAAAARRLGIATKTVETHKARILAKLGARTQAEAVATAARRGLLSA
jgi:DNA-binding NarL/FixJ family response regulator